MRLREVREILNDALPRLKVAISPITAKVAKVSGLKDFQDALRQIEKTGVAGRLTRAISRMEAFTLTQRDEISIELTEGAKFHDAVANLQQQGAILASALDEFLGDDTPATILVKIPEMRALAEVGQIITSLDRFFNQLLPFQDDKARTEFRGFDCGSSWIVVFLGSLAAVNVVGRLAELYFSILERRIELDAKKSLLKDLTSQVDTKVSTRAHFNEIFKALDDKARSEEDAEIANFIGVDPVDPHESLGRVRYILQEFGELIVKGVELHPALVAPPETKNLFSRSLDKVTEIALLKAAGGQKLLTPISDTELSNPAEA